MTVERDNKTCTNCNQAKPKKEFHRMLTLAQSRALLHRPHLTQRHTLVSSLCKTCQAQLKRNKAKRPLTAGEIKQKIKTGDINPVIGEKRIKRKTEIANAKKAIGQKTRWQKERMKQVNEHLDTLRTEVAGFRARYYAYKNHLNATYTQIIQAQQDLLDQHRQNYEEARQAYNEKIKPLTPRPTDPQKQLDNFLNIKLTNYFTPRTDAKTQLQHVAGLYQASYNMSNCMVTARKDKWWQVIEDRGAELLVVDPHKPNGRGKTLKKCSITGVSKLNEGESNEVI